MDKGLYAATDFGDDLQKHGLKMDIDQLMDYLAGLGVSRADWLYAPFICVEDNYPGGFNPAAYFVEAPRPGGEFVTKPLTFMGQVLTLNLSTSAAGSIRVELQDAAGKALEGFTLNDCIEIVGDRLDYPVRWRGEAELRALTGKPIRLRFVMQDADVYAVQFKDGNAKE